LTLFLNKICCQERFGNFKYSDFCIGHFYNSNPIFPFRRHIFQDQRMFSLKLQTNHRPLLAFHTVRRMTMTPFLRRTHFCITNLGIWQFFGQAKLYSYCSLGNQNDQKIIHFYFFNQKSSKSTMSKFGTKVGPS